MICALLLAAGEGWESAALTILDAHPGVVVLKRCVDVDDLMAIGSSHQADVAVLALDAPGLDPAATAHLRRHGLDVVGVTTRGADDLDVKERAQRLDIAAVLAADDIAELPDMVTTVGSGEVRPRGTTGLSADAGPLPGERDSERHRVIAVWGPAGAPGRTTVAVNLAAEIASRSTSVLLVDGDPYGGTIAQQLGILDEVSGLLAAARLAGTGELGERWTEACRSLDEHLHVVTGIPRADRWREVRGSHVEQLLDLARTDAHVVVDTGFCLEEDAAAELGGRPSRNALTMASLDLADEVVVVGAADPVGLARLARGLVDLGEHCPDASVRVVVNRMRSSIGWAEKDIAAMVDGFVRISGLHFLPEDRVAIDRGLVAGRSIVEHGSSALAAGIEALADSILPETVGVGPTGLRRRIAGRARRR